MRKKNKLVCGVGVNDADYEVFRYENVNGKKRISWRCLYYEKWVSILKRCYSKKEQLKCPTYKGCSVCEEWLTFSSFKRWMEKQEWQGLALDKDFLIEGNKIYSPSTCVFIPQKLNNFTTTRSNARGQYPLGVHYVKKRVGRVNEYSKPYKSRVYSQTGKRTSLGMFVTSQEAHQAYLKAKLRQCDYYLLEFEEIELIIKGLTRIRNKIEHHIKNNLELTSF